MAVEVWVSIIRCRSEGLLEAARWRARRAIKMVGEESAVRFRLVAVESADQIRGILGGRRELRRSVWAGEQHIESDAVI